MLREQQSSPSLRLDVLCTAQSSRSTGAEDMEVHRPELQILLSLSTSGAGRAQKSPWLQAREMHALWGAARAGPAFQGRAAQLRAAVSLSPVNLPNLRDSAGNNTLGVKKARRPERWLLPLLTLAHSVPGPPRDLIFWSQVFRGHFQ